MKPWKSIYAVPTECVHGVALGVSCPQCSAETERERLRKQLERQLRGTPLGRLAGLR